MEQENRINNPKPWILQLFCKHEGQWFRKQSLLYHLGGKNSTRYALSVENC